MSANLGAMIVGYAANDACFNWPLLNELTVPCGSVYAFRIPAAISDREVCIR